MKMNKSILTGMTALSLFATSAAAATSAVTPVVSNAAAKKTEVNKVYTFNLLMQVKSKGHATHYFNTVYKTPKISAEKMQHGYSIELQGASGYKRTNPIVKFRLNGNHVVRVTKGVYTFTNTKHKAIKDSVFVTEGTYRISKAEFNKLNKQQTR